MHLAAVLNVLFAQFFCIWYAPLYESSLGDLRTDTVTAITVQILVEVLPIVPLFFCVRNPQVRNAFYLAQLLTVCSPVGQSLVDGRHFRTLGMHRRRATHRNKFDDYARERRRLLS